MKHPPKNLEEKSVGPYSDCPTGFGEFAAAVECYTKCGVVAKCREATELAEKTPKTPVKKVQANVQPEDDDTV